MKVGFSFFSTLGLFLLNIGLYAQEFQVIDHKGTIKTVRSNSATVSQTQPGTAVEGDLWADTSQVPHRLSIYDDSNQWTSLELNRHLGSHTFHHITPNTLQISSTHTAMDIHLEGMGNLDLNAVGLTDRDFFYITNTTDMDRTLAFRNFSGIFVRQGGQGNNLITNPFVVSTTATLTLKGNTRYMVNITVNPPVPGGNVFANISYTSPEIYKAAIADLNTFTVKTAHNASDVGSVAYNSNTTTGPGMVYWSGNTWIKLHATHRVSNELLIQDIPNDYIYISFMINNAWKVIRYTISNVNVEVETTQASNTGVTQQPTTLAVLQALSF